MIPPCPFKLTDTPSLPSIASDQDAMSSVKMRDMKNVVAINQGFDTDRWAEV